ncbi:MAG: tetratricopeptide repeat protein [Candidatus Bipolaricaulota bacterium]|nr:tetratricopeptide repeat protein [Candidatus Bipolaricaulota bacterium]
MNMEALETREEQEAFVQDALEQAEALRKKKKYKEGISLLVEALRYGIDKATIYYRLGNIYIDGNDFNRAEYAYKRALEMDSHHANAMHNLSIVYKRQKKIALYVKTYKKSQRMEFRSPRKGNLAPEQKARLRRLSIKILLGIFAAGGVIVLVIALCTR